MARMLAENIDGFINDEYVENHYNDLFIFTARLEKIVRAIKEGM